MENITEKNKIPLLFEAAEEKDLAVFASANQDAIDAGLKDVGTILFRGFTIQSPDDFDHFISAISDDRMDYVYGSTPRTAVGNRIFTATEYPSNQEIPLHSEVAYHTEWPARIALSCIVPAETGGATPVADLRCVTASLGTELVEQFKQRKVRYVRNYHPHVDVPWQQVFRTESKKEVARFCRENGIEHDWLDDDVLRTSQVCQGTLDHPDTGETFMFNQAHLFHISSIEANKVEAMKEMFGYDRLPRNAFFGDGEEIPVEVIETISAAYEAAAIDLCWQQGDVALLDNFRMAHGRRTFTGERKVLAALMEPVVGERAVIADKTGEQKWWKFWS